MRYAVIYERDEDGNVGAYVPDLPGCIAAASTLDEARTLIREALEMHLAGMREDGDPLPDPSTEAEYIDAA
jgi:predicted RNase H-like HicB family nuclease